VTGASALPISTWLDRSRAGPVPAGLARAALAAFTRGFSSDPPLRSSYLSELTTGALCFGGWWALWNWRRTRRVGWLLSFGVAVGWCVMTRPLTR